MFYVAGFPVKLMSEGITEADTLALIPITNKSITEFYPRAEIPACAPAPAAVRPTPPATAEPDPAAIIDWLLKQSSGRPD